MNTKTMTTEELRKAAKSYDLGMNEGGEGYNPYTNEIKNREMKEIKKAPRGQWEVLKDLERYDCSIAKECGTYNAEKVAELRKELADLKEKEEKEFIAKWTPEYTTKIRTSWNLAIKNCGNDRLKINNVVMEYQKTGIYLNDIKKAVKLNNL